MSALSFSEFCVHRRFRGLAADILYSFDCSNAIDDISGAYNGVPEALSHPDLDVSIFSMESRVAVLFLFVSLERNLIQSVTYLCHTRLFWSRSSIKIKLFHHLSIHRSSSFSKTLQSIIHYQCLD